MATKTITVTIRGPKKSGKSSIAKLVESNLRSYLGRHVELVESRPHESELRLYEAQNRLRALAANEEGPIKVLVEVR